MIGGLRKANPYFLASAIAIGLLVCGGSVAKAASVEQLEATMQAQMRSLQRQVDEAKAEAIKLTARLWRADIGVIGAVGSQSLKAQ